MKLRSCSWACWSRCSRYAGFASTWTVRQNEEGIRLRFGRPVGVVSGGLHVTMPYPIERIVRVPTTEVRVVQVGVVVDPDTHESLPRRAVEGEAHWLTGDTNIVELRADVLYTVTDPVAYLYGFAASEEGTTHEGLIRATSEAVLTRLLAGTTIESTLATGKIELSRRGMQRDPGAPRRAPGGRAALGPEHRRGQPAFDRVIRAFNDVSSAKADRERLLAEAEGILGTVLPRARAPRARSCSWPTATPTT